MIAHADKTQENKTQSAANVVFHKLSSGESNFQFVDNRPDSVSQRKLQKMANNSPRVKQLRAFQDMANNSLQAKQAAQLQSMADDHSSRQQHPVQKKENNTGLPDNLKSGIENLSDYLMDDVRVHYNSDKPAQLQAHAYAQGTDIHLASSQEKQLPHEAWHVVQQKQGRVKPTMQKKGKVNINDDTALEKEADMMGAKALNIVLGKNEGVEDTKAIESIKSPVSQLRSKSIKKAKKRIRRVQGWERLLVQRGLTPIQANVLANGLANSGISFVTLDIFIPLILINGWNEHPLLSLIRRYSANDGVCNAQQWATIGAVAAFVDHEADVAHFARAAGWTPANIITMAGLFNANDGVCNAQQWATIAIAHANLTDQEASVADLARMAGWNPVNIPIFASHAFNPGLNLLNLQAFIGTPNAVGNCLALIGWGANVVGTTVAVILSAGGAPTNAQTVQLLGLANAHGWAAANLLSAANAVACGAPNWANVIINAPIFAGNWAGIAGPGGMVGAVVVTNNFAGAFFGGGYQVRLRLRQQRVYHVWNGHSFEHFDMTYANSTRNGVGGNITFYLLGTPVGAQVQAHVNSVAGQNLADQVARDYPANGVNPNSFRQNNMAGDRVGIASRGNRYGGGGGTYPTELTQCYPRAGTVIVGRNLVAIGRLMGRIP